MWRIWKLINPITALVAQAVGLFGIAVMIHLVLLSTPTFNWMDGPNARATKALKVAAVQADTTTTVAALKQ
jgi:light-harvesting complex 1 alpha chain